MFVEFEKREHVCIIKLNRPEARNAINAEVANDIEAALDKFESDSELWVGILTADGPVFCAGADLKEIAAGNGPALYTKKGGFGGIVKRDRTKPLIAAVPGTAVAGGCELALACDMIIAAETCEFGLPEVKRSLVAAAGGLFRLPRLLGTAVAMEIVLTGDTIPASRAYELGMVNKLAAKDEVVAEALKLADRIVANAPLAVQASRKVVAQAMTSSDEELWKAGNEAFGSIADSEDYQEGPRAFIEKRAPVWKAR